MTHRADGVYRILSLPWAYEWLQQLLGARAARKRFVAEFLRPHAGVKLLDIGCGTGSLLDDLPDDVVYYGFDLNPAYIEAGRARRDPRAQFYQARVGAEPEGLEAGTFDLVVAKGILHHLSDRDGEHLVATAARSLRRGGTFVSIDPLLHDRQSRIARTIISLDRGRNVRTASGYERLMRSHFATCETARVTDLLRIPYSHFVMRATKS